MAHDVKPPQRQTKSPKARDSTTSRNSTPSSEASGSSPSSGPSNRSNGVTDKASGASNGAFSPRASIPLSNQSLASPAVSFAKLLDKNGTDSHVARSSYASPQAPRQSPSRFSQRMSHETTTPNTIRTTASPASKSSPHRSPFRREDTYSPSQQLHAEFARFHIDSQLALNAKLDRKSEQLATEHNEALAEAAIKHEDVLRSAQKARERLQLQLENEVIRRRLQEADEAERVRKEKIALEQAEQQRKLDAAELLEREAEQRRSQARATAEAEERARQESQKLANEAKQREEEAERKRLTEEAAQRQRSQAEAEQAKIESSKAAPPATKALTQSTPLQANSGHPESTPLMQWDILENIHTRYLDLHRRLKAMRKDVMAAYKQAKNNPRSQLTQISDMRRTLAKLLGQFTSDKAKNKQIRNQVEQIMTTAWNITDIALDAKEYVLHPEKPWPNTGNTQVSGVFIYLVNILTKLAIESMGAASRQTAYNAVDYYGVVLSWIVSNSKFRLHGNSFADVIIAKFHASCPPLFGIYGPENTAQGRNRLGWKEEDNSQEHFDKVNALAIGWGALTLRDYTRLAGENSAIPAWHYWQAVACVVNVPPPQLTKTHGIVLKGLVDQYAHLFIKFYGQAAIVALRKALVQLPGEAPESAAFDKVKVVRDNLHNRLKLQL